MDLRGAKPLVRSPPSRLRCGREEKLPALRGPPKPGLADLSPKVRRAGRLSAESPAGRGGNSRRERRSSLEPSLRRNVGRSLPKEGLSFPIDGRLLEKRGLSLKVGFEPNAGLEPKEGRFPALSKLDLRSGARGCVLAVSLPSSESREDDLASNRLAVSSSQGLVKLGRSGRFDSRVKGRRSRAVAAPESRLGLFANPVPTLRGLGMNLVIRPDVSPVSLLSRSIATRESVSVLGGTATARNAGSSPVT